MSVLASLLVGVTAVLGQGMTTGALIAGMMLIWRVLGPLQAGFVLLSRWEQTRTSIRQLDSMMALETEHPPRGQARMAPPQRGDIVFQRVSLRYLAQAEPVLSGVSFSIQHGEVAAITGGDGSGKSSLMKLVAGIYRPQGGVIRINGHDVRSYDPGVLRRSIAWVPQTPELLYGTIAQNLRLARPSATDAMLQEATEMAHVREAIEALPNGFNTRVGDNSTARLPRSIQQRIALARAVLREAPILMLDEPVSGLDDECAAAVGKIIAARRGHATILMATHRPSDIRIADRVLHLSEGQLEVSVPGPSAGKVPLTRLPVFSLSGLRS
jgi:ATP-binding cassette subfamily C protein/ATP-binding cassette subfamily C protein LapB